MIRDAEAAVVAFLDEAILSLKDPAREVWAKQTLSVDLYGESKAGEVFFERLDEIKGQTDSPQLADLLEVFLLCLELGFEGRYAGPLGEVGHIVDRLKLRIDNIRGNGHGVSPPFRFAKAPVVAAGQTKVDLTWRWWLIGSAALPVVLFALFKLNLGLLVSEVTSMLPGVR
jgi:type IV/VI secretion system ImpK/VasF family protein